MPFRPPVPRLEPLFQAHVDVDDPLDVGAVATGQRKVIPITGGSFTGERLKGRVIPGGADWQIVAADGTAYLEARYTLKTHDEALIYVRNIGVRHGPKEVLRKIAAGEIIDPGQYYFRATPQFETGASQYAWLNIIVAVCSGMRTKNGVFLEFYEVQ